MTWYQLSFLRPDGNYLAYGLQNVRVLKRGENGYEPFVVTEKNNYHNLCIEANGYYAQTFTFSRAGNTFGIGYSLSEL